MSRRDELSFSLVAVRVSLRGDTERRTFLGPPDVSLAPGLPQVTKLTHKLNSRVDHFRKFILEDRWKIPDISEEELSRRSGELWAKLK